MICSDKAKNSLERRRLNCINLVIHLQKLFVQLILGWEKYYDPTPVLSSIVYEKGNQFNIGMQEDIIEFNCNFIARIEEGIIACENEIKINTVDIEEE